MKDALHSPEHYETIQNYYNIMKQLFTLALAGLLTLSMHAQTPFVDKATTGKIVQHTQALMPSMENRESFWYNDVSACDDDWEFGNGSMETGLPWQGITIDFECSTVGPAGPYNAWAGGNNDGTPAPAIQSTTNSNGFLLIDSDEWGQVEGYDAAWVENSWVQTVAPIDCSTHDYVALEFETRYRCFDNGASDGSEKCFIEISRDGYTWPRLTQNYVTTWEDEGMVDYGTESAPDSVQCRYEVFPDSESGYETANAALLDFDITEAAGGQSQVWIRFRWVGTWGYSWEIDDISMKDIEENDLRIDGYVSYTNYLQTGIYENGAWPQSQLLDSWTAGAKVFNFGYSEQENVVLDIDVNGYPSSSAALPALANASVDTLTADYAVSELGTYTVNYSISSDEVDDLPSDNVATQSFEVTEYSYGRDNGELFDLYGGAFEYACMPYFDIHNDVTIYGIDVAIMEGGEAGSSLEAWLIDLDDASNLGADGYFAPPYDMNPVAESGETYLNADVAYSGTGDIVWYTFEFEDPYDATAGQTLGGAFEYFGGSELLIAESSVTFESAGIYGPGGADNDYAWRRASDMPMVRLNLDPDLEATEPGQPPVGVAEVSSNLEVFESIPNPASSESLVRFVLSQPQTATLEVRDMQGRVMMTKEYGTLVAGEHNERLDVSTWAAGTYTYTLTMGDSRQTRKLVVE